MSLFRSKRDIEFIKRVNEEYMERVVGEKVTYYPISKELSRTNIYGESKEKIVDPPVELYAIIEWQDQDPSTTEYGQDIVYNLKVDFFHSILEKLEIMPREGDYLDYDGVKFEITQITEPRLILGKAGERLNVSCLAKGVREGTFKISISGAIDQAKRTSPDEQAGNKSIYDDVLFPYSGSQ